VLLCSALFCSVRLASFEPALAAAIGVIALVASETGAAIFPRISRPLDFKRAILGAVEEYRSHLVRPLVAAAPATPAAPAVPAAERIRQLKGLLDEGLISPQEFEAKRRQLLDEV